VIVQNKFEIIATISEKSGVRCCS